MHQQSNKCFFLDEAFPVIIAFFFRTFCIIWNFYDDCIQPFQSGRKKKYLKKKKKELWIFWIKFAPKFH